MDGFSIDLKLKGYGFSKIIEKRNYVKYIRKDMKFGYDHIIEIRYDDNLGKCTFNTDVSDLFYSYKYGDSNITYDELLLFIEKMKVIQDNIAPGEIKSNEK